MNQENLQQTTKGPQKALFAITKSIWGNAYWETLGFPIPSDTGNYRSPTPSLAPPQLDFLHL